MAISEMKEEKAVGVDEIPSEMLKNLGDKALQELCGIVRVCKRRVNGQMILQKRS